MFEVNLLTSPGINDNNEDKVISFLEEYKPKKPNMITKKKVLFKDKKERKFYSRISLFSIVFFTISGILFYPVLSKLNFTTSITTDRITTEQIIDNVLKIILESKKDTQIETLQFLEKNILVRLSASQQNILVDIQKEFKEFPEIAIRIYGDENKYTLIAKFPWSKKKSEFTITNPDLFFNIVKSI